jgi:polar amino acid transport system substrate-binding protein
MAAGPAETGVSNHRLSGRRGALATLLAACTSRALAVAGAEPAAAPERTLRIATLEWPPYVSQGVPENGLSVYVASAAARQAGWSVRVDYFPWKRAMQVGLEDASFAGYFPAYYTEERARNCWFSAPIGRSTIGFAYLRETPLRWERLADLKKTRIGVVAGFANGAEFDAMVQRGELQVDASPSDVLNIRKLIAGRVRAAVVDRLVLRYLLLTEPELAAARDRVAFHETPLADLTLHVCFQRTPAGLQMQKGFDAGLKRVDIERLENAYFQLLEASRSGTPR